MRQFLRGKFIRDTIALQIGRIGTTGLSALSSLLVVRVMGVADYGVWSLTQSFLTIWLTLNLTGVNVAATTRLAMAVGAGDEAELLNLSAIYVQVSILWSVFLTVSLALLGPLISSLAYNGDTHIGVLAIWLSLTTLPDALYNFVLIALQSQRSMRSLAILSNLNQVVFLICVAVALVVNPVSETLVIARIVYSTSTMFMAFWFYSRDRRQHPTSYPALSQIFSHVPYVSPRPYWRFGFLNALDKSISNLYTEIPLQIVGILIGPSAAGFMELGYKAITICGTFTSAIADNLEAIIPQAIGRGDFANLRRNLSRVLISLTLAAIGFYAVFALAVPFLVLLFGQRWLPAVPVIIALSVYGAVTMVGGIFGPLYRALNLLRSAIIVKIIAMVMIVVPGWLWIRQLSQPEATMLLNPLIRFNSLQNQQTGATAGAWVVNGLYIVSVALTVVFTLPALKRQALEAE